MHNPSSFGPIRSPIFVKNQGLPHPHHSLRPRIEHRPIFPGGFPVAGGGGAVSPEAGRVFPISEAKEIPLVRIQLGHFYKRK